MTTAVFGFIGVIIGAIITGFISWMIHISSIKARNREIEAERKERFRVMTFEKRLETYQKAYCWWNRINEVLNYNDGERIHEISNQAREWWNNNCLLLDTDSRENMVGLMNTAHLYANGNQRAQDTVWDWVSRVRNSIIDGIATEHLPVDFKESKDTM